MTPTTNARPRSPAQLPPGFDAWLLDCAPVAGCDVCGANWRQLLACKQAGNITQAMCHATEIRDHPSGVHVRPSSPKNSRPPRAAAVGHGRNSGAGRYSDGERK
ncbi:hypothetical protein [Streptomyces rubradiris]|uniref:Uncharacterized protein n=1 Tax=Streptomyces rubradiris TaxID=285531 RepID=A0ABQ3RMS3_STRRR|nr:hypothetical protein [Streptomyces rubradiris]GHH03357.1 hypothetical protein GCM10018792_19990 [Streptomyces rubradiris]GHI57062.1 hypothetical protein Srubr_69080 [Streptomyces rubradiris]